MTMPPASAPQRDLLLCLSHLRWDFVFQRPQHLLSRAARNFRVVFVEEPVFQDDAKPEMRLQRRGGVLVATPVLPAREADQVSVLTALVEALAASFSAPRTVLWYYTPMALPIGRNLTADCIVYDCMDELSAFRHAPQQLRSLETALLAQADLVFTGGESLYEAKRGLHPHVHCFPSSIDSAHFGQARSHHGDPIDQATIPHPRIGFFGVIDERLDTGLLQAVAALRPDWQFVMLGPLAKIAPADLPQAQNIHWLGPKTYGELPAYLGGWDAGFMPFAINDATRFISPTKTPEFLAAGLPVVSTPIRDVVRSYGASGLVEIAAGPAQMVDAIERQLHGRDPGWIKAVDRRLARSSWDETWNRMQALIERVLAAPPPSAVRAGRHSESQTHV